MGALAIQVDERVKDVRFTEDTISVDLMDGRSITVPLVWYPKIIECLTRTANSLGNLRRGLWHPLARPRRRLEYRRDAKRRASSRGDKVTAT
jgi:hypothetical protein